jgi:protein-S-isoprenylcysteine O-methyltransferase Ste14
MGATKIEFRLRMAIMAVILTLGFWAPWMGLWQMGPRIPLLMALALELSRHGLVTFSVGLPLVVVLAALTAAKGVVFRVWGAAYMGPAIVIHGRMRGDALVASGPYRHVRNPLYIGLWAMTAALAFLMPPTGALFVFIAVPLFLLRLTLGEEAFLGGEIGQPYRDYLRAVPRLVPRFRSTLPPSTGKPQWLRAIFAEFTSIGVFLGLASFFWSYNLLHTERIILVCFGISLLVRALLPKAEQPPSNPPL